MTPREREREREIALVMWRRASWHSCPNARQPNVRSYTFTVSREPFLVTQNQKWHFWCLRLNYYMWYNMINISVLYSQFLISFILHLAKAALELPTLLCRPKRHIEERSPLDKAAVKIFLGFPARRNCLIWSAGIRRPWLRRERIQLPLGKSDPREECFHSALVLRMKGSRIDRGTHSASGMSTPQSQGQHTNVGAVDTSFSFLSNGLAAPNDSQFASNFWFPNLFVLYHCIRYCILRRARADRQPSSLWAAPLGRYINMKQNLDILSCITISFASAVTS